MSRRYFGTDGIRGRVGEPPITPDFVLKLGYAAGKVLSRADVAQPHRARPAVLIGKDTRISGYMLESALESGLSAAGVDTLLVAVTGWVNEDDKRRALEAGFDAHLTKPIDVEALEKLLKCELNGSRLPATRRSS